MVSALPDVPLLHPGREAVAEALLAAGGRVAAAFASADPGARAGSLEWTVQQLAAHLATGADEYLAMVTGGPTKLTDLADREAVGAANIAAEAATPALRPAAVSPPISVTSIVPIPPGVGIAAPAALPTR